MHCSLIPVGCEPFTSRVAPSCDLSERIQGKDGGALPQGSTKFRNAATRSRVGCSLLILYICKFNQQKSERSMRGHKAAPGSRVNSYPFQFKSIDAFVGRFALMDDSAAMTCLRPYFGRASFPAEGLPKTVSSTRCQYASMIFGLSADNPLVAFISGPNPESVALRLTIM